MKVRSKAPLRLGLAGGGTDVSPYSDRFGGYVLNATINLYAHCTIEMDSTDNRVVFTSLDLGESFEDDLKAEYPLEGSMRLFKAAYNRIVRDFNHGVPIPVKISTWADAPPGSGLGTSSTLVVAIVAAFQELLSLPLGEYDLARLAYDIERVDCGLAGGKQDQYAATFGGFNFMEFYAGDRVVVNPLRIRRSIENELQSSLLLFFTGRSRDSARIIDDQVKAANADNGSEQGAVAAMHSVKQFALDMKESLLKGDIAGVQSLFRGAWEAKKRMAVSISTSEIDRLADYALASGANAVKISGAGGGGFMMMFVEPTRSFELMHAFKAFPGEFHPFQFTHQGAESWVVR